MNDRDLLSWLAAIPSHHLAPLPDKRKRKRAAAPPTPPPDSSSSSTSSAHMTSTPAKRPAIHVDDDIDQTPRPARSRPAEESLTSTPSKRSRTSQSSFASGSKRIREAESSGDLCSQSFSRDDTDALPEALRTLQTDLEGACVGAPIISSSRKHEISAAGALGKSIRDFHFLPPDSGQVESPTFRDVCKYQKRAAMYNDDRFEEAAWSACIIIPLLELAISDIKELAIIPCTTAKVADKDLLPRGYSNCKMVDICLALEPSHVPKTLSAVRRVQHLAPSKTINHTDYHPLSYRPIGLSIEVKRPSGSTVEAVEQLAVWQYAQWKMLEILAMNPDDNQPSTLEGLDFLPGISIVGHEWSFSATIRHRDGNVVQWKGGKLGDTTTAHGIYSIVWGLRRIAKYLTETYWPWYEKEILRMAPINV
ncbi:uncharacterized protein PpBr36_11468 [Pyricularia pennisetigena]|uniref:uncharacterized protein n=1 Tax=Pyricularia pennisetigena TaxID=1578925 RepID=UPI00115192A6|nr:uncharacterized protein PpBr36_11468 [Pyricularia pennisetigena]TLS20280.1 hypothetical protein PpBr36_11468 [Pyricularia pennisetigena]